LALVVLRERREPLVEFLFLQIFFLQGRPAEPAAEETLAGEAAALAEVWSL
jgi:hypothetical protein